MPNSGHNQKLFSSLRSIGRRLSRFKILEPLRPLARSFLYTAEPAGRVLIDSTPAVKQDEKCRAITIVSANLWHDFPHYRRMKARLEDFISMVIAENADILLLQEVARTPLLHADTQLSKRLNMAYLYSRVNGHRRAIGFEEGLAVFSRYPLVEPSLRQLSKDGNPFTRRLALGAVLDTPCGHIYAFSTHLSIFPRQNAHQAAQLRDWVQAVSGEKTAIIAGDFNADENQPHIIQKQKEWVDTFRQVNPGEDGTTHELRGPFGITLRRRRLDYVFIKPGDRRWKVLETRHLHIPHAPHSDHHAVLTRLAPISA
jgi:endonuclease/exonuclease/phosphatase family metal-dependent hydrolase